MSEHASPEQTRPWPTRLVLAMLVLIVQGLFIAALGFRDWVDGTPDGSISVGGATWAVGAMPFLPPVLALVGSLDVVALGLAVTQRKWLVAVAAATASAAFGLVVGWLTHDWGWLVVRGLVASAFLTSRRGFRD